jgi:hypothetical protein
MKINTLLAVDIFLFLFPFILSVFFSQLNPNNKANFIYDQSWSLATTVIGFRAIMKFVMDVKKSGIRTNEGVYSLVLTLVVFSVVIIPMIIHALIRIQIVIPDFYYWLQMLLFIFSIIVYLYLGQAGELLKNYKKN